MLRFRAASVLVEMVMFWECTFLTILQVREHPELMPFMARDRSNWSRCWVAAWADCCWRA